MKWRLVVYADRRYGGDDGIFFYSLEDAVRAQAICALDNLETTLEVVTTLSERTEHEQSSKH